MDSRGKVIVQNFWYHCKYS